MSCSLKIVNLKAYNDQKLLFKNLNLHIKHKEKIAIIGSNGAGKTTLLEIIAGLKEASFDEFEIFHTKMTNKNSFKEIRNLIGYLFQESDNQFLFPVVEDDIAFSLLANDMDKKEAQKRVSVIMNDFNITHLKEKIVYELSGGEKKLVALAGVLVNDPKLMLLDEPTNGLDYDMQERLKNILKNIDKSIIIVSHNIEFVESLVDKIYIIDKFGLTLKE